MVIKALPNKQLKNITMKLKVINLIVFILIIGIKFSSAQVLQNIEPNQVRNDKPTELILSFSNYNFNKNLKPLIYFTTPYNKNEDVRIISEEYFSILNDSTIKYIFNPVKLRVNDTILDINIQSTNSKGFNEFITWRNALKISYKPGTSNLKLIIENLPDSSKTNPKNYPSNLSVRVKYPNKNSHFTHNSTKVIIKGTVRSFIIPDSFTVINDSLMDVFFTLNDKAEKCLYNIEVDNDLAFKLMSNSFINLNSNDIRIFYYNINTETTNEYQIGDSDLQYEFSFTRKLNQPIKTPYQFNLEAYLNNNLVNNITKQLVYIKVDTIITGPNIADKKLYYSIVYKVNIDSNAKKGIYSFNFYNDSVGNNWFGNVFKVNPPKIEVNESLNYPGFSGTISVYCSNRVPFKVSTNFRFLKNNVPTNDIKIDTFYYYQNATQGFQSYIKYTSKTESDGKYDIEITNQNIDTIIIPQILTISEYFPKLLSNYNYFFNKGDTVNNVSFERYQFVRRNNDSILVQNLKPFKNGVESKQVQLTNVRSYSYSSQTHVDFIIDKTAEPGWYDITFDTATVSRNFIQKNAFYICDKEIKSFTPSVIAGAGQMLFDFTLNFSNTNFTKAKYVYLNLNYNSFTNRFAIINYNIVNDTTVIFKMIFNNEYVFETRFLPIVIYNDYDGYMISRNKLQIEVAPNIVNIEPNWAEKERYSDIYFYTKHTSLTQINPDFISPIFYKNNQPVNHIWVVSRSVINDTTLKVNIFPNSNAIGEYEIGMMQNQNFVNYTNRKKFSVSKTGIINIKDNKDLSIYPIPTSNILNIEWHDTKNKILSIEITDLEGRVLYQTNNMEPLNLATILSTKGMYFINLKTENLVVTKKFIFN
jgi:hypothetical protein